MTSEPSPDQEQPADWEAFYNEYRKPGYVPGFEITTKLGGGMFGLVFRARRMSIGKDYAIKFLKVDDGEVRRAVLSELEQVKYFAQIDHPNLVSIEDRGEVSGIPYLVMAYAGSETLRDKMPVAEGGGGRVPTAAEKDELLRYFLQSARGLQALHDRSLVHFDIKPANVFLKGGVARLGDYGLSKLVTHSRGSLSMGRGTPYYMAPEMLQRRGDARSDIYSMGVMLYEVLCGKVPFTGDSEWEVLRKHENTPPELPDHLNATERTVLQRCLAKDPAARFESVQQMIESFGAPTSAAAAALRDVRAGADLAGPQPAPGGKAPDANAPPPPPPPGSEENPYKEMADASAKAFRHANKVAQKAMRDANRAARRAAKDAREKWQSSWTVTREFSNRRYQAWKRLRKQKKEARARDKAIKVATAVANPDADIQRKNLRRGRTVAMTFGGLVAMGLIFVAIWVSVGYSSKASRSSRWQFSSSASAPAPAVDVASLRTDPTLLRVTVPEKLSPLVSGEEPKWSRLRTKDSKRAKRLLLERISKLRRYAPMSPKKRINADLPAFEMAPFVSFGERQSIENQISVLLRLRSYDRQLAKTMIARSGATALAIVAGQLADLEYKDKRDIERARRLHRVLQDATTCRDLQIVRHSSLGKCREYNQPLGELWLWFVNEFAFNERCWHSYRKLMRL